MSVTSRPWARVVRSFSDLATADERWPSACAAARTAQVGARAAAEPAITRLAVAVETSACRATSRIVGSGRESV
jgi:hypothetical protein